MSEPEFTSSALQVVPEQLSPLLVVRTIKAVCELGPSSTRDLLLSELGTCLARVNNPVFGFYQTTGAPK